MRKTTLLLFCLCLVRLQRAGQSGRPAAGGCCTQTSELAINVHADNVKRLIQLLY